MDRDWFALFTAWISQPVLLFVHVFGETSTVRPPPQNGYINSHETRRNITRTFTTMGKWVLHLFSCCISWLGCFALFFIAFTRFVHKAKTVFSQRCCSSNFWLIMILIINIIITTTCIINIINTTCIQVIVIIK